MAVKISSYQKLKKQLKEANEYNHKLLNDPSFYTQEHIKFQLISKMSVEIDRLIFFGDSNGSDLPQGLLGSIDHD